MERKIKTLIAAAVVAVGLGISLAPLTSYAVDPVQKSGAVSVKVNSTLTLELAVVTPGANDDWEDISDTTDPENAITGLQINVAPGMMAQGKFTATVSSSQKYTLSVNGYNSITPGDATNLVSGSNKILGNCSVEAATKSNCWQIKVDSVVRDPSAIDAEATIGTIQNGFSSYQNIPSTALAVYQSTAGVRQETSTFNVGVSASSSLPSGDYTGTLVVTAANV